MSMTPTDAAAFKLYKLLNGALIVQAQLRRSSTVVLPRAAPALALVAVSLGWLPLGLRLRAPDGFWC